MYKATNHKPVSWIPREMKAKKISCDLDHEFHAEVMQYCEENQIKLAQLVRFALARTMANA